MRLKRQHTPTNAHKVSNSYQEDQLVPSKWKALQEILVGDSILSTAARNERLKLEELEPTSIPVSVGYAGRVTR